MRTFGYQLGYAESTLFSVFSFETNEAMPDVETAIEALVAKVVRPLLVGEVDEHKVAIGLYFLARGGYDSDRSYEENATETLRTYDVSHTADQEGFVLGAYFPEEVIQDVYAWISKRRAVDVYRPDGTSRKARRFVLP